MLEEDWELESRRHEYKMETNPHDGEVRLPAKIVIFKTQYNDNQTYKRTFRGITEKGIFLRPCIPPDDDQGGPRY